MASQYRIERERGTKEFQKQLAVLRAKWPLAFPVKEQDVAPAGDRHPRRRLWVPKGTPKNITAKLNAAVMDALAAPTMRARLADGGKEIFPPDRQTPEALAAFQKAEIEKWWPIIKAAGITPE